MILVKANVSSFFHSSDETQNFTKLNFFSKTCLTNSLAKNTCSNSTCIEHYSTWKLCLFQPVIY